MLTILELIFLREKYKWYGIQFSAGASLVKISKFICRDLFLYCFLTIYSDPDTNLKTSLTIPKAFSHTRKSWGSRKKPHNADHFWSNSGYFGLTLREMENHWNICSGWYLIYILEISFWIHVKICFWKPEWDNLGG